MDGAFAESASFLERRRCTASGEKNCNSPSAVTQTKGRITGRICTQYSVAAGICISWL